MSMRILLGRSTEERIFLEFVYATGVARLNLPRMLFVPPSLSDEKVASLELELFLDSIAEFLAKHGKIQKKSNGTTS
ncbi:MAG: hypothetical protein U1E62_06800 [Alsobacter sp.]